MKYFVKLNNRHYTRARAQIFLTEKNNEINEERKINAADARVRF